jgi:hypothetical protein
VISDHLRAEDGAGDASACGSSPPWQIMAIASRPLKTFGRASGTAASRRAPRLRLASAGLSATPGLLTRGCFFVVLFVVDLPTRAILPLVDVLALLRSKLASVGGAVGGDMLVDILLPIFRVGGF